MVKMPAADPLRLHPERRRARLCELMERNGLTAPQVAYIVGRCDEHVRAWKNGRSHVPEPLLRLLELELETREPRGIETLKLLANEG